VPFLIVESDCKATNTPSTLTISPNTSNKNFEIAILFNVVDFLIRISFLRAILLTAFREPPKALRERVESYTLGAYKVFI
jgi:hypothetical protein